MALAYSQWIWGFEVFDSGPYQNNKLDFVNSGTTYQGGTAATLTAGVYTPDELAAQVQSAMRTATGNSQPGCAFSYSTLKFTLSGTMTFSLLFGTGSEAATDCNGLLGFNAADKTALASYASDQPVGTAPSTASLWTAAEPQVMNSPINPQPDWQASSAYSLGAVIVPSGSSSLLAQRWKVTTAGTSGTAQPSWPANPIVNTTTQAGDGGVTWTYQGSGSPAALAERRIRIVQNVSDGMTIESIYFGQLKRVRVAFTALLATEQTNMENFLNWIVQGKRFTWQPDKTSVSFLKLVAANPGEVADAYEWLTRPEVSYGTLSFYEQLS